ncbi:MAG: transcription elongation factor GreA [Eubacteriales bacterium]|nr:transcription elongation factor GreA [Eubacteriales bacterium]
MHNELTPQDIREMEKEIEYRKLVVRPKALEDVKEARAHGDLSENFEYHAAKKVKNQNESRIRYLERMIKTAVVLRDHTAADEVGINKTVTLYIKEDKVEETYSLVTTVREDSLHGLVSVESPMGKALLGHKVGDTVTIVVSDSYSYEAEIRKIEESGEAEQARLRNY